MRSRHEHPKGTTCPTHRAQPLRRGLGRQQPPSQRSNSVVGRQQGCGADGWRWEGAAHALVCEPWLCGAPGREEGHSTCGSRLPTYTVASWLRSDECCPMRLYPTPALMRPCAIAMDYPALCTRAPTREPPTHYTARGRRGGPHGVCPAVVNEWALVRAYLEP